jgi:hypothetical protein
MEARLLKERNGGVQSDGDEKAAARKLKISLYFFAATGALALAGFLALVSSFATWESGWVLGTPGDAVWITGLCAVAAIPCSLASLAFGLPLIRRRPVVLLWVLPLAGSYLVLAVVALGL